MLDTRPVAWMLNTTADNLEILIEALPRLELSVEWMAEVVRVLRESVHS